MSDSETIVIVGQCTGITEKPSGWTEFQISVTGKQYPVKLATKLEDLIQAARDTKGQIATWTYNETEGGMNPRSGKPYKNRYLEKVELGATAEGQSASAGTQATVAPEPHHEPMHFADKDRVITRLALLKVAAQLTNEEEEGTAIEIAERLETWVYRDIDVETNDLRPSQKLGVSTASGTGLPMPQSWDELKELLTAYGDNEGTWEMFQRFAAAARKLMFGDQALSGGEKDQLWQVSVVAALALRDLVDASAFPPPEEDDVRKAWASALEGQELQPVAKKEIPDAP